MPRDLPDLLTDALPRDAGAPDLAAIESRVARRRAGRLGGAVLALAAAVAVGVQVLPLGPPAPMIDQVEDAAPDGTTVLPLPPVGEVAADHANGRPVFVVHDDGGAVRVLDAISPHDPSGMPGLKVLAYCTRSGWFEDLWHGSKFAGNGAWVGGPAPYGLAEHTVVAITAKTVTVGPMATAPARGEREGEEPTGESCTDVMGEDAPDALVLHDPAAEGAVPGLLYPELRDGEVVGPDEPQLPLPGPDVTLAVPAPGEVSADHVNGRPVFVINHDDGNVLVLDAVDPHVTRFGPKVLAWCRRGPQAPGMGEFPAGGVALDLWYSSTFAGRGMAFGTGTGGVGLGGWAGGPAPTGLGRLPVRTVTGETATVAGSPLPAPPRVGNESIADEGCSQAVSLFPDAPPADPTILEDLVLHEPRFEDDWWYPTPARILGEEPGLPPAEWERYLEEAGLTTSEAACAGGADVLVDDVDLDGDGEMDLVRHRRPADDHVEHLVVCLADGGSAVRELMGPLEDLHPVVVGGRDALFLGGTTAYSSTGSILRLVGDRLVPLGAGDPGPRLTFGALAAETWSWGCRAANGDHEDELVTVHTDASGDDARMRVTIEVYGVDGAVAEPVDTITETRDADPAAEHPASDIAAELGLRPGCARA